MGRLRRGAARIEVALVEQGDWASATSSASSKLIHGGLRYLETYDFKMVRKALKERKMLLQVAPHRVWPLRFGVPVYDDSRNGTLKLKAGLTLYDTLAGFPEAQMRHRHFGHAQFSGHFPFLEDGTLKGGFTYGDAQTDDARLVLELVAGALEQGAVCVNYAKLVSWIEQRGQVCGAAVHDGMSGITLQVRARQCVSTAGQWTSETAQGRAWCRLSKGIHLVMPALQTSEAILLTAKQDGRVFFIIPWYGRTLLGTTDTDYSGDIDRVVVEAEDVDYLLAAANGYFKTAWSKQDVIASYAGVRVMKQSDAAHPSEVSRDWELKSSGNGLLTPSVANSPRRAKMRPIVVDAVCARLGVATRCRPMAGGFRGNRSRISPLGRKRSMRERSDFGIDTECAKWLMRRHGVRIRASVSLSSKNDRNCGAHRIGTSFLYADLLLCARDEMALHLSDLLRRRMPF